MDVLMGPTFSIDISAPPAADYSSQSPDSQRRVFLQHGVSAMVLERGGEEENVTAGTISISKMDRKGPGMVRSGKSFDDSSDSSSSVGAPDDSDEEEEGEESNSASSSSSSMKKSLGLLGSLDALEDSLPIKRGLSNYFTGKSKSFASLADASLAVSTKDLEKPEHPFNKRRRILMANKWNRRSSFYSWTNPKSMPLLTLNEDDNDEEVKEGDEEEEEQEDGSRGSMTSSSSDKDEDDENEDRKRRVGQRKLQQERKFNNSFKCHSCFSLTDLQQQQRLQQNLQ
ncbi:Protein OXIDATIVE STRESS 3 LIKE 4 [Linum perenne]